MPFELVDLKLAFQYHLVLRIVTADDDVANNEDAYIAALCPPKRMIEAGFFDKAWQVTPVYQVALKHAQRALPKLPREERQALLSSCVTACLIDGRLHPAEVACLRQAAFELAFTIAEFDSYLDQHPVVGKIDLDHPIEPS